MPDVTKSYGKFSGLIGFFGIFILLYSSSNFHQFCGQLMNIKVNLCKYLWLRQSAFTKGSEFTAVPPLLPLM